MRASVVLEVLPAGPADRLDALVRVVVIASLVDAGHVVVRHAYPIPRRLVRNSNSGLDHLDEIPGLPRLLKLVLAPAESFAATAGARCSSWPLPPSHGARTARDSDVGSRGCAVLARIHWVEQGDPGRTGRIRRVGHRERACGDRLHVRLTLAVGRLGPHRRRAPRSD
jgi:hypothetical protein